MQNKDIDKLIKTLSRLPGLGQRSAKRAVLYMLQNKETYLETLITQLQTTKDAIVECIECGNLDTSSPCSICSDSTRRRNQICVIETLGDLWAMERTHAFKGVYHILGGTLSALDGIRPEDLNIDSLLHKVSTTDVSEVIIALKATVDGQTTAHYLADKLENYDVHVTKLAHGMPVGGELDYMDDGTITMALNARAAI